MKWYELCYTTKHFANFSKLVTLNLGEVVCTLFPCIANPLMTNMFLILRLLLEAWARWKCVKTLRSAVRQVWVLFNSYLPEHLLGHLPPIDHLDLPGWLSKVQPILLDSSNGPLVRSLVRFTHWKWPLNIAKRLRTAAVIRATLIVVA